MKIIITESQFNHLKDTYRIGFDGANGYAHIDENIEDEVEASEVDLSSFKPKPELTDKLWKNGLLDSKVRLQLLDIADDFVEFLQLDWIDYDDIILTGSICNFNWSDKSDIDVHVVYDFGAIDDRTELVRQYVDAKRTEWNEMHENLTIYGFNVELYVEDINESAVSKGVYSLEKNEWLKKPNKQDVKLQFTDEIKELSADLMTMIDDLEECYIRCEIDSELEEIYDKVSTLLKLIKNLRKKQLANNGEMSVGNIVYKSLRREDYMDRLYDLQNQIYDDLNSLN